MVKNPEVEALQQVDRLDTKAAKLRRDIADIPLDLEKHKAQAKAAAERVEKCREEQKKLDREIHRLQGEVSGNGDQIKKYQTQQNQVKTNEEYSTLKKQIDALQKANSDLDDKALVHYETIDKLKAEEAALKKLLAEADQKLKGEEAQVGSEVAAVEAELKGVLAEREAAAAKAGAQVLGLYQRILDKVQNRALAAVRGRICQGCHIEIPPNNLSTILSGNEIVQCRQCARILYLEDDYRTVSATSYLVSDKRDDTSKDGNW